MLKIKYESLLSPSVSMRGFSFFQFIIYRTPPFWSSIQQEKALLEMRIFRPIRRIQLSNPLLFERKIRARIPPSVKAGLLVVSCLMVTKSSTLGEGGGGLLLICILFIPLSYKKK